VFASLFQIALGALRAGTIAYFVPNSVIKGMLAAIGLIIILKQLPHAIGYDAERFGLEDFVIGEDETT
jgi:MFS superfamily sulfate permease-like transporter